LVSFYAAYIQEIEADPSPVCVGGSVTIRCEIVFTDVNGTVTPVTVSFRRFANNTPIVFGTANHQLLRNGPIIVVGVRVTNITPNDNNTIYTCLSDVAGQDLNPTSLMLEVVGNFIALYVYTQIALWIAVYV